MVAVDAFLDSLEFPQAARRTGQLVKGLSEAAGMPVQISAGSIQNLEDSPRPAALEILEQVEAALLEEAETQVTADLERWLGQLPAPTTASTVPDQRQDLCRRLAGTVRAVFEARKERLLDPQGKQHAPIQPGKVVPLE
jgi:hypothetical protein